MRLGLVLVLASAGHVAAQSPLLVVDDDGGPGVDHTSIAAAVAAAPELGTILVRSGTYGSFEIDGKSLVVVAQAGATVTVAGATGVGLPTVTLSALSAGQVVVLEGLSVTGSTVFAGSPDAISVEDCLGQVWLQDCSATGGTSLSGGTARADALAVTGSDRVLVTRCELQGGGSTPDPAGAGVSCAASRVHVFESSCSGSAGGAGALVESGFFFAEGSTLQGGDGIGAFGCTIVKDGGPGLLLGTGEPSAVVFDTLLAGGQRDPIGDPGGCAEDGPDSLVLSGTLSTPAGASASFDMGSPFVDGQPTTITLEGEPGDQALVLVALSLGPVSYLPKYKGALAAGSPLILTLGPIPGSGTLMIPANLGEVLLPGQGSTFFVQGAVLHAGGGGTLADPVAVTSFEE